MLARQRLGALRSLLRLCVVVHHQVKLAPRFLHVMEPEDTRVAAEDLVVAVILEVDDRPRRRHTDRQTIRKVVPREPVVAAQSRRRHAIGGGLPLKGQGALGAGTGPALTEDGETTPEAALKVRNQPAPKGIAREVLERQATGDLVADEREVEVVVLARWLRLEPVVAGRGDVTDVTAAAALQAAHEPAVTLQEGDVAL